MNHDCARRSTCHADCTPSWWCFFRRLFDDERCITPARDDCDEQLVSSVRMDSESAVESVALDQEIRKLGGL